MACSSPDANFGTVCGGFPPEFKYYAVIVLGEPLSEEYIAPSIQEVAKGLKCWNIDGEDAGLDGNILALAQTDLKTDESGRSSICHAGEDLGIVVLISPNATAVKVELQTLLSHSAQHKCLVYGGHVVEMTGDWVLSDDTFSLQDVIDIISEENVQSALSSAGEEKPTLSVSGCHWPAGMVSKQEFTKLLTLTFNPSDIKNDAQSIPQLVDALSTHVQVPSPFDQLEPPTIGVGVKCKISKPTVLIFPAAKGDCAFFAVNDFSIFIGGGYPVKPCFWKFAKHLHRIDAILLPHMQPDSVIGINSLLQRKIAEAQLPEPERGTEEFEEWQMKCNSPEVGVVYVNAPEGKSSPLSLVLKTVSSGNKTMQLLRDLDIEPIMCTSNSGKTIEPITLYQKVGIGKLDMFILSPPKDAKELKDFMQQWSNNAKCFTKAKTGVTVNGKDADLVLSNVVSVCALIVWQPYNPNENIVRVLFPGNAPQNKILEGLDRCKDLDFLKHADVTKNKLKSGGKPTKKTSGRTSAKGKINGAVNGLEKPARGSKEGSKSSLAVTTTSDAPCTDGIHCNTPPPELADGVCTDGIHCNTPPPELADGVCKDGIHCNTPPPELADGICSDGIHCNTPPPELADGICSDGIHCNTPPPEHADGVCTDGIHCNTPPPELADGICTDGIHCNTPPPEPADGVCTDGLHCNTPPPELADGVCIDGIHCNTPPQDGVCDDGIHCNTPPPDEEADVEIQKVSENNLPDPVQFTSQQPEIQPVGYNPSGDDIVAPIATKVPIESPDEGYPATSPDQNTANSIDTETSEDQLTDQSVEDISQEEVNEQLISEKQDKIDDLPVTSQDSIPLDDQQQEPCPWEPTIELSKQSSEPEAGDLGNVETICDENQEKQIEAEEVAVQESVQLDEPTESQDIAADEENDHDESSDAESQASQIEVEQTEEVHKAVQMGDEDITEDTSTDVTASESVDITVGHSTNLSSETMTEASSEFKEFVDLSETPDESCQQEHIVEVKAVGTIAIAVDHETAETKEAENVELHDTEIESEDRSLGEMTTAEVIHSTPQASENLEKSSDVENIPAEGTHQVFEMPEENLTEEPKEVNSMQDNENSHQLDQHEEIIKSTGMPDNTEEEIDEVQLHGHVVEAEITDMSKDTEEEVDQVQLQGEVTEAEEEKLLKEMQVHNLTDDSVEDKSCMQEEVQSEGQAVTEGSLETVETEVKDETSIEEVESLPEEPHDKEPERSEEALEDHNQQKDVYEDTTENEVEETENIEVEKGGENILSGPVETISDEIPEAQIDEHTDETEEDKPDEAEKDENKHSNIDLINEPVVTEMSEEIANTEESKCQEVADSECVDGEEVKPENQLKYEGIEIAVAGESETFPGETENIKFEKPATDDEPGETIDNPQDETDIQREEKLDVQCEELPKDGDEFKIGDSEVSKSDEKKVNIEMQEEAAVDVESEKPVHLEDTLVETKVEEESAIVSDFQKECQTETLGDEKQTEEPKTEGTEIEELKTEESEAEEPTTELNKLQSEELQTQVPQTDEPQTADTGAEESATEIEEQQKDETTTEEIATEFQEPQIDEAKTEESTIAELQTKEPQFEETDELQTNDTATEEQLIGESQNEELNLQETEDTQLSKEPHIEEPESKETEEPQSEETEEPYTEVLQTKESEIEEQDVDEPLDQETLAEDSQTSPAEEPQTEEPKIEKPHIEELAVKDTPMDEFQTEEIKTEEPTIDEPPVNDSLSDEQQIEEPSIENHIVNDPEIKEDEQLEDEVPNEESPSGEEQSEEQEVVDKVKIEEEEVETVDSIVTESNIIAQSDDQAECVSEEHVDTAVNQITEAVGEESMEPETEELLQPSTTEETVDTTLVGEEDVTKLIVAEEQITEEKQEQVTNEVEEIIEAVGVTEDYSEPDELDGVSLSNIPKPVHTEQKEYSQDQITSDDIESSSPVQHSPSPQEIQARMDEMRDEMEAEDHQEKEKTTPELAPTPPVSPAAVVSPPKSPVAVIAPVIIPVAEKTEEKVGPSKAETKVSTKKATTTKKATPKKADSSKKPAAKTADKPTKSTAPKSKPATKKAEVKKTDVKKTDVKKTDVKKTDVKKTDVKKTNEVKKTPTVKKTTASKVSATKPAEKKATTTKEKTATAKSESSTPKAKPESKPLAKPTSLKPSTKASTTKSAASKTSTTKATAKKEEKRSFASPTKASERRSTADQTDSKKKVPSPPTAASKKTESKRPTSTPSGSNTKKSTPQKSSSLKKNDSKKPDPKKAPSKAVNGKPGSTTKSAAAPPKEKPIPVSGPPVYIDLTYVPNHASKENINMEFFRRVRAKNYVISGNNKGSDQPSLQVLEALLEGKTKWEDKDLEVTVISTYDTQVLQDWEINRQKELEKAKIIVSQPACSSVVQMKDETFYMYKVEF